MRLDSVRALKSELTSENLWAGVAGPRTLIGPVRGARLEGRTAAIAARPGVPGGSLNLVVPRGRQTVAVSVSRPRTALAIGIRGQRGSYRLALRVQEVVPGIETILRRLARRARGEVDVRIVGRVVKQAPWRQRRNRPLRIGGSVGHVRITAGTLGCFVTPRDGNAEEDFILSNNHVLANENKARKGDSIVQPGPEDGGRTAKNRVGSLAKVVRLRKRHNVADAATAELLESIEYYYNFLEGLGPIRGVRTDLPEIGETVYKLGRTTGLTKGRVSAVEIDGLRVEYDRGILEFDQQVEIEPVGDKPFSLGGDSGSLIVDSRRRALGLLFAGNDVDATYANPIHEALDLLKVRLVY